MSSIRKHSSTIKVIKESLSVIKLRRGNSGMQFWLTAHFGRIVGVVLATIIMAKTTNRELAAEKLT